MSECRLAAPGKSHEHGLKLIVVFNMSVLVGLHEGGNAQECLGLAAVGLVLPEYCDDR